jgi:uncharacterized protein YeaO (DUF488 family)
MEIKLRRAYQDPENDDGVRVLVDRLWPRGLSKERLGIDLWARELAPSAELRRWYGHDPGKWEEFKRRYFKELDTKSGEVMRVIEYLGGRTATFVYASREEDKNNAVALKEYFESGM